MPISRLGGPITRFIFAPDQAHLTSSTAEQTWHPQVAALLLCEGPKPHDGSTTYHYRPPLPKASRVPQQGRGHLFWGWEYPPICLPIWAGSQLALPSPSPDISWSLPSLTPECIETTPSGCYQRSPGTGARSRPGFSGLPFLCGEDPSVLLSVVTTTPDRVELGWGEAQG